MLVSECLRSFNLKKKVNNNKSKTQMPRFFVQRFWFQHVWSGGWDSCAPEHCHLISTPGCCGVQTNLETTVPNEEGVNIYCNKCRRMGFPDGLVVKNLPSNAGDTCVQFLGVEDLWGRKWQPTPVFLPGKYHGHWSLAGYSPWGHKRIRHEWVTDHTQKFRGIVWSNTKSQFLRSVTICLKSSLQLFYFLKIYACFTLKCMYSFTHNWIQLLF